MEKVLIIGANGKVGRKVVEKVKSSGDWAPVAFIRKEEQKARFDDMGVESRIASLESEKQELAKSMEDIDAIVFTAGSGADTGYDKTLSVDLDGAIKAMEAAKETGIKRFIHISALNTGNKSAWESSNMKPYYIAKYYADEWLKNSGLDYTILRPGRLTDEPGTGRVTTENPEKSQQVPREDVANMILGSLQQPGTVRKIISFNKGDVGIEQALEQTA